MLRALKIETVHGLIALVEAERHFTKLDPDENKVVSYNDNLLERLSPSTPFGKAKQSFEIGLLNIIRGLSREQKIELVALMWLGRDGGDWGHLLELGRKEVDGTESNMPVYVTDKSDLDEYLDDGLERLHLPRYKKAPQPA